MYLLLTILGMFFLFLIFANFIYKVRFERKERFEYILDRKRRRLNETKIKFE